MKTSSLLSLFVAVIFLVSCGGPTSYTLDGTVGDTALNGEKIYIIDLNTNQTVDSTVIADGKFSFSGKQDSATLALLNISRVYNITFILENGKITPDWENNTATGTPTNELLVNFKNTMDNLQGTNASTEEFVAALKEFYKNNQTNDVGTIALHYLSSMVSTAEMERLLATASDFILSRNITKELESQISVQSTTAEGKPFVDFTIDQEDGSKVSLSDYVGKGKYVLVDFWASWCAPCRAEMPAIASLYNKYKNKNFEVLGVAVWDKVENTKTAINELGLTWPQILDAQTIPTKIYGIDGIPHLILFAPDGTIAARNLRGDQLKAKLAEVMGE
jgi:Peroxiredoxin